MLLNKEQKSFWIIGQAAGSLQHGMVFRPYFIATELIRRGHSVKLFAASFSHTLRTLPETTGRFTEEVIDGVPYCWVRTSRYPQSKSFGRVWSMFEFSFKLLSFNIFSFKRPDVIIVSSPPPVSILVAFIWAKVFRAKLCFEVRDIWPLSLQRLGRFSCFNPFIAFIAFVEWFAYKFSDEVFTVLPGASDHILSKGGKVGHIHYLPNGIENLAVVANESKTAEAIANIRKDSFVVGYTGSLGIANAMTNFVEIANRTQDIEKIKYVVVGSGPDLAFMKKKAIEYGLKNIHFFEPVPKIEVQKILQHFDLCYIGFKNSNLYEHGISPNKVFDYMLAAKPILMIINSKYNIVEDANCGFVFSKNKLDLICDKIKELVNQKELLNELGKNGAKYVRENHSFNKIVDKLESILK